MRIRRIKTVEEANRFLRDEYIREFNRRFTVPAAQRGERVSADAAPDLDGIFSIQHERRVNQDNAVALDNRVLQIPKTRWRNALAGCTVMIREMLDDVIVIRCEPQEVARFAPAELPVPVAKKKPGTPRPLGTKRRAAAA